MTCKIERPAPQDLFNRYLQMFSNTVMGGAEIIPETNEWYAASVNYAIAEEFYAISEQAWKDRDPREACCESLIAMAERDGVYPMPAQYAQGYVKLTGTVGTELPSPLEFTIGGQTFVTAAAEGQASNIGEDGIAYIRVRALLPGATGNLQETTGDLNTTVAGVESEVEVCGGTFCGGADAEECETFRARYLRRLQYNPRATNQWMQEKLLEWPCATRAITRAGSCCQCNDCAQPSGCTDCGCVDCGGQLAFYLMFDNTFPCGIATPEILAEAEEWMFGSPQGYGLGQVEVGICGRLVPVTGLRADVLIDIQGCPTPAQISDIRNQVTEFFSTLEPNQPVRSQQLGLILGNVLGGDANYSASFRMVDNAGAYGPGANNNIGANDTRTVYVTNCDLEPECDYMICLNDILINRADTGGVACS